MTETKFAKDGHGGFVLSDTCWEEFRPWFRPAATDFLVSTLPAGAKVLEWGAGSSTVFWARQGYHVTSLELDGEWYHTVQRELDLQGLSALVNLIYFCPQADAMKRLQDYADHALVLPAASFDLVVVDGRNRNRCLGNSRFLVKEGGLLCLDNSERWEYAAGKALYQDWPFWEWGDDGWSTAVFEREAGADVKRVVLENADA
jgi:hypothetical protein